MITPSNLTPTPNGAQTARVQRPQNGTAAAINIETSRLSLNALKPGDVTALMAVFAPLATARQTHAIPHPFSESDAGAYIDAAQATSFVLPTLAIRNEEGHLIGVIALSGSTCGKTSKYDQLGPNVSLFIAEAYQKKGYGPEAVEGLLKWVAKNRLHKVVQAAHFADNLPSAEALINAGFLYTGRKTFETSRARDGEEKVLHMIRLI